MTQPVTGAPIKRPRVQGPSTEGQRALRAKFGRFEDSIVNAPTAAPVEQGKVASFVGQEITAKVALERLMKGEAILDLTDATGQVDQLLNQLWDRKGLPPIVRLAGSAATLECLNRIVDRVVSKHDLRGITFVVTTWQTTLQVAEERGVRLVLGEDGGVMADFDYMEVSVDDVQALVEKLDGRPLGTLMLQGAIGDVDGFMQELFAQGIVPEVVMAERSGMTDSGLDAIGGDRVAEVHCCGSKISWRAFQDMRDRCPNLEVDDCPVKAVQDLSGREFLALDFRSETVTADTADEIVFWLRNDARVIDHVYLDKAMGVVPFLAGLAALGIEPSTVTTEGSDLLVAQYGLLPRCVIDDGVQSTAVLPRMILTSETVGELVDDLDGQPLGHLVLNGSTGVDAFLKALRIAGIEPISVSALNTDVTAIGILELPEGCKLTTELTGAALDLTVSEGDSFDNVSVGLSLLDPVPRRFDGFHSDAGDLDGMEDMF